MEKVDSLVLKRSKGIGSPSLLGIEDTILPDDLVRKTTMGEVKSPRNGIETKREAEAPNIVGETGIQENPRDGRERKGEMGVCDTGVQESRNGDNEGRERKMTGEVENPRSKETPPDDDCCSICFGDFEIPCKTNCGHWFCARCILMLWNYGRALQSCKCPICTRRISKLTPEASLSLRREEEVVEALKKVERYNRLYVGGARGLVMKVHELPLLLRRCFGEMIDPSRLRFNYYMARLIALLLAIFYEFCGFDFLPTGRLGAIRVFQYSAFAIVILLLAVGLVHRLILHIRVRRLAAFRQ